MDCCVDEATTNDPMSSLRFVPPFAPTLPHRDRSITDPFSAQGAQGQGQYHAMGRQRSATDPLSMQQQQQQSQYYNPHHHALNQRMGASVDSTDDASQGGSYIYEYTQGGPSVINTHLHPHPPIIYPHDDHKLALVLNTSSVDWNCPHIVTFVLEYLLGDNFLQLQGMGSHQGNNKTIKGGKARGGGRGKRTVNPMSIQEVIAPCDAVTRVLAIISANSSS